MRTVANTTVYHCDYCRKKLLRKHAMVRHELNCYSNPINKPKCSGCIHLEEIKKVIGVECSNDHDYELKANSFWCNKLKMGLYPQKAVRLGLIDNYPEQFEDEKRMPTECEHFEDNNF